MLTQGKMEKRRFSSNPFTTWHYKKVTGQHHAPAALTPGKKAGAHFMGDWVRLGAGIKRHGKSRPPPQGFFCTLSLLLCPNCPGYCLLSLLYNTHNTNIHAPGGIRSRNPSKRSASDPRLRTLVHWDRQFDPRNIQPEASRYTD